VDVVQKSDPTFRRLVSTWNFHSASVHCMNGCTLNEQVCAVSMLLSPQTSPVPRSCWLPFFVSVLIVKHCVPTMTCKRYRGVTGLPVGGQNQRTAYDYAAVGRKMGR
jgi:hypothetical protein